MGIWKYLLLTIAVELPIIVLWLSDEWKKALIVALLLNLFTWPLLVTIVTNLKWNILLMECGVAIVEGYGYRLFFRRNWIVSMAMSFFVNGLSYGLGLLL